MFYKEVRKVKNESKENIQRIMNKEGPFVNDEMDLKRKWREHFENLHNSDT